MYNILNINPNEKKQSIYKLLAYCIILYSIIVRCSFFIEDKFFWLDESYLFFSLYNSDFLSVLTQNNIYFQTYPSLFGVVSFVFIKYFGVSSYLLRFIPFLSSCIFFVLMYIVSKKILNERYAIICLIISSFNYLLLYYCDEFKQYSLEACITLALLLYYLNNYNLCKITYNFVFLSLIAVVCSTPSPFIVATITICIFLNYLKNNKNIMGVFCFVKNNCLQLFTLGFTSIVYYLLCLKSGDANNGNAWESGMIPLNIANIYSWLSENFILILSRLMTNACSIKNGTIFLLFSILGAFVLCRQNVPFSSFTRVFIAIFIISIFRLYSLGNVKWGMIGARLSMYVLPIFILHAGYFIHHIITAPPIFIVKTIAYLKHIVEYINVYFSLTKKDYFILLFVAISLNMSVLATYELHDDYYEKFTSYDDIANNILLQHKNSIILAHSFIWYSLQYYNISKGYDFDIIKIGNEKTPTKEYPPLTISFTAGIYNYIEKLKENETVILFIPFFYKDKILRFIDDCGASVKRLDFKDFYILLIKKQAIAL